MTAPPHLPAAHLLDSTFTDRDAGLVTPVRNQGGVATNVAAAPGVLNAVVVNPHGLTIRSPARADPPGYQPNAVPRGAFNSNVYRLTASALMPEIAVDVTCTNFTPSSRLLLHWRLQAGHVFCRHQNTGNYHYRGHCEAVSGEWHGTSSAASFRLFAAATNPDAAVTYLHNAADSSPVGGNLILSVAVRPPNAAAYLLDYVHLRISGANPTAAEARTEIDALCVGRSPHVATMAFVCFRHESNFRQFGTGAQTQTTMNFVQRHHGNNLAQPDCAVQFDWPDDPANFPKTTFDFGVGISQYTITPGRHLPAATAWNWKANVTIGINLLLSNARAALAADPTLTWSGLAREAWRRYNGGGPQATAYANTLAQQADSQTIPNTAVPATAPTTDLVALQPVAAQAPAPAWPPP